MRSHGYPADGLPGRLQWSARPGLWVTASPDPEVLKKVALKRWRLALDWKDGSSPEEYAAGIQNIKQSVPGLRLLVTGPGLTVEGFSPDLLKLAKLLAPKEMSESQIMGGGLDELGQNFITLLRELRPPVF